MKKLGVFLLLAALLMVACGPSATPTTVPTAAPAPTQPPAAAATATTAPAAPTATKAPVATAVPPAPTPLPVKNTITISLAKNLSWSDGAPFTAKDVVGTYNVLWMQSSGTWNSLADVVGQVDGSGRRLPQAKRRPQGRCRQEGDG
ncbi:MAG: hypothetical protein HY259_07325 [Chloroflexi bacterium]|nr:hypothetical protein [Chloroflexota bacterium]